MKCCVFVRQSQSGKRESVEIVLRALKIRLTRHSEMNILLCLSFDVIIYFAEACIHPCGVQYNSAGPVDEKSSEPRAPILHITSQNILLGKEAAILDQYWRKKNKTCYVNSLTPPLSPLSPCRALFHETKANTLLCPKHTR